MRALRQHGDIVPIRVLEQGAVRVNEAYVEREYDGCLLLHLDLRSKRAVLFCTGHGEDSCPCVYLSADEHSLHLDQSKPLDALTVIEFPENKGWEVFCASPIAKYSTAITLVKKEK